MEPEKAKVSLINIMDISVEERARLRAKVLDFLKANEIAYELYEHPVLCTIEECLEYWGNIRYIVKTCSSETIKGTGTIWSAWNATRHWTSTDSNTH